MKKSGICPKCTSSDIIYINEDRTRSLYRQVKTGFSSVAEIELYICGECGYVEEHIGNQHDIDKIKKSYR